MNREQWRHHRRRPKRSALTPPGTGLVVGPLGCKAPGHSVNDTTVLEMGRGAVQGRTRR